MSAPKILKFPTLLICGCLVSNAAEIEPKKRPFRAISPPAGRMILTNVNQPKSDLPALKIPDQSGRAADSEKAIRMAQTYFKRGLWESASKWYYTALQQNPKSKIAAEGYVMSEFRLGHYQTVYGMAEKAVSTSPHLKTSVTRIAPEQASLFLKNGDLNKAENLLHQFPQGWEPLQVSRDHFRHLQARKTGWKGVEKTPMQLSIDAANTAYQNGQYSTALWNLEKAARDGFLPRDAQLVKGRSLIHLERFDEASRLFEKLYQTQTDTESARGVVVSLHKKGDRDRLARLAQEWGGILAREAKAYQSNIEPDIDLSDDR